VGEIADMMLDGTMDPETGEFNFDGEDGPGFPMTGAEAAAYRQTRPVRPKRHGIDGFWRKIAEAVEGTDGQTIEQLREKMVGEARSEAGRQLFYARLERTLPTVVLHNVLDLTDGVYTLAKKGRKQLAKARAAEG
jgi:hypothetical protein